jgi:hypothetical protein
MKRSDATARDAARAVVNLDIRITPQKLKGMEPPPIARAVHFARQNFSLRKAVRGFGAEELRRRSPHIEALIRAPERGERVVVYETND